MIAFPELLIEPAKEAGIPVPKNPRKYVKKRWPQFHLFCCAQLGQAMPNPTAHWHNAKVIAKIKPDRCMTVKFSDLRRRGFQLGSSK